GVGRLLQRTHRVAGGVHVAGLVLHRGARGRAVSPVVPARAAVPTADVARSALVDAGPPPRARDRSGRRRTSGGRAGREAAARRGGRLPGDGGPGRPHLLPLPDPSLTHPLIRRRPPARRRCRRVPRSPRWWTADRQ